MASQPCPVVYEEIPFGEECPNGECQRTRFQHETREARATRAAREQAAVATAAAREQAAVATAAAREQAAAATAAAREQAAAAERVAAAAERKTAAVREAANIGAPAPQGVSAADDTVIFWASVLDGTWNLVSGGSSLICSDLYRGGRTVYVRPCYAELVQVITHEMLHNDTTLPRALGGIGRSRTLSVYGTPGVGKSIFASLLVGAVGRLSPGATIFYHAGQTRSVDAGFLVFGTSPRPKVEYMRADIAGRLMYELDRTDDGRLVWLIVDGVKPPIGLVVPFKNCRIIVVSSANLETKKWLNEWDKHTNCRLLMDPFNYDEVVAVNNLMGEATLQQDTLDSRLRTFGGAARMIFDPTCTVTVWLDHFIGKLGSREALGTLLSDTGEGSRTQHEDKSSRIVHLRRNADKALEAWRRHVGDVAYQAMGFLDQLRVSYDYQFRVADLASPAVKDALANQFWRVCQQEVRHRLATADAIGSIESHVVSWLFEPKMHGDLCRGSNFNERRDAADANFGGHYSDAKDLVQSFFRTHRGLANTVTCGWYNRPISKNCPSFDAFLKTLAGLLILFQMTGQANHPINMLGMLEFFQVPLGTPESVEYGRSPSRKAVFVPPGTVLYFVVTPRRFSEGFSTQQRYVSRSGGPEVSYERSPHHRHVRDRIKIRVISPVWTTAAGHDALMDDA